MLTPAEAADRLDQSARAVQAMVLGIDAELARWRPAAERWSIVEITCHLLDEEREDFRPRLDLTLHRPDEPFARIDPAGWALARRYRERELAPVVREWAAERAQSLRWLRGLAPEGLARTHAAPWGGTIAAGDLLASWVAHDLLHSKQILKVLYDGLRADCAPFGPAYAGEWK